MLHLTTVAFLGFGPHPGIHAPPPVPPYPIVTGMHAYLTMHFTNDLPTPLSLQYWTGRAGDLWYDSLDSNGGTKLKTGKDFRTVEIPGADHPEYVIEAGYTGKFYAEYSSSGDGAKKEGAIGYLSFAPSAEYRSRTGLKQVIAFYEHSGGPRAAHVNFYVNFTYGDYSDDKIAQYASCDGGGTCAYAVKDGEPAFNTYYCPYIDDCSSNVQNLYDNTLLCGSKPLKSNGHRNLYYNACPATTNLTGASWEQTGPYGPNLTPLEKDSTALDVYFGAQEVSGPIIFPPSDYKGNWEYVGTNVQSYSLTYGTSWSHSESDSVSNAYSTGLEVAVEGGANWLFGSTKISTKLTETYAHTSTTTISDTNGGTETKECGAFPCEGTLYQWRSQAEPTDPKRPDSWVSECAFQCIPSNIAADPNELYAKPKCPRDHCMLGEYYCQCCNSAWGENKNDATPDQYVAAEMGTGGSCYYPTPPPSPPPQPLPPPPPACQYQPCDGDLSTPRGGCCFGYECTLTEEFSIYYPDPPYQNNLLCVPTDAQLFTLRSGECGMPMFTVDKTAKSNEGGYWCGDLLAWDDVDDYNEDDKATCTGAYITGAYIDDQDEWVMPCKYAPKPPEPMPAYDQPPAPGPYHCTGGSSTSTYVECER